MIRNLEVLGSSKVRRETKTRKSIARKRLKAESGGSGLGTRCFTDSQLITWTFSSLRRTVYGTVLGTLP